MIVTDLREVRCTELGLKTLARLGECRRQAQADVVSNSRNKIHQTLPKPFSPVEFDIWMQGVVTVLRNI